MEKLGQGEAMLSKARRFMSEDDYGEFKKILALRDFMVQEKGEREVQGVKFEMAQLRKVNAKITSILDKYTDHLNLTFDDATASSKVDSLVKQAIERQAAGPQAPVQEVQPTPQEEEEEQMLDENGKPFQKPKVRQIDKTRQDEINLSNAPGGSGIREFNDEGKMNADPTENAGHNFG